jgi:hypothetical protein
MLTSGSLSLSGLYNGRKKSLPRQRYRRDVNHDFRRYQLYPHHLALSFLSLSITAARTLVFLPHRVRYHARYAFMNRDANS